MFCVGVSLVNLGSKQKKTNVIKKSNNACAQSVLLVMFFPFYLFIYFWVGRGVLSKHVLCKCVSLVAQKKKEEEE